MNDLSVFGVYCPYKASRRLCHHRVRVSVHRVCIFRQRCRVALRAKLFFLLYFFLLLFQLPKAQRTKSIRKMQQVKKNKPKLGFTIFKLSSARKNTDRAVISTKRFLAAPKFVIRVPTGN